MKYLAAVCLCYFGLLCPSTYAQVDIAKDKNNKIPSVKIDFVINSWERHNSFNLLILESLSEENLSDYPSSKGRNVGEQFNHIFETRLNWIREMDSTAYNPAKTYISKISINSLKDKLIASSELIKIILSKGLQSNSLRGYRGDPIRFYTYLISHESHHRGQILLSLKQGGHPAPPQVSYGIWRWED